MTIALDKTTIVVATVPISTGMAITSEIKTGHSSILEYLFVPLVEVTSQSVTESKGAVGRGPEHPPTDGTSPVRSASVSHVCGSASEHDVIGSVPERYPH